MNSCQITDGQVLADYEDTRCLCDQRDRREVACGIVEQILVERLVLGVRSDVAVHKLISVGRCFRDPRRTDTAAATANVFDNHWLPQELLIGLTTSAYISRADMPINAIETA